MFFVPCDPKAFTCFSFYLISQVPFRIALLQMVRFQALCIGAHTMKEAFCAAVNVPAFF